MSEINWRHDGRRIVLPIIILRPGNPADMTCVDAVALLDTGATASGIDIRLAEKLGLEALGKRPLQSANGLGHAERYIFRFGLFPDGHSSTDLPYIFEEVYGFGLTGSDNFTALIGMDILSQCSFSIDSSKRCRLALP